MAMFWLMSRLTAEEIEAVQALRRERLDRPEIARMLGISVNQVISAERRACGIFPWNMVDFYFAR